MDTFPSFLELEKRDRDIILKLQGRLTKINPGYFSARSLQGPKTNVGLEDRAVSERLARETQKKGK